MPATFLQLRPEAQVEPTDDGLLVLTHQGTRSITGAGLGPWLDAIRPLLDGSLDRESIRTAVPEDRADAVLALVDRLVSVGVVREIDPADPPAAGPLETFVAYFRTGAAAVVASFLETPVAVIGSGVLIDVVADGLSELGLADVRSVDVAGLDQATEIGAVVQIVDGLEDADADVVARWCDERRVPLVQVLAIPERTWLAVPPYSEASLPGLSPVMRRISARGEARPHGAESDSVAARIACFRALHEFMRWSCGVSDRPSDRVIAIDDSTLESSEHPVVPYPTQPATSDVHTPAWSRGPRTREEFLVAAARISDSLTGVFSHITEGALAQLPLNQSTGSVWLPGTDGTRRLELRGAGIGFEEARIATALRCLAAYSVGWPDPGRVEEADVVPGIDLQSGRHVGIPAGQVFERDHADVPRGVGAGLSWDDAVEQALAPIVGERLRRALANGTTTATQLNVTTSDDRVSYLMAMLRAVGEPTGVAVVGDPGGMRGIALTTASGLGPVHWRRDPVDALVAAMSARLLARQEGPAASETVCTVLPARGDLNDESLGGLVEVVSGLEGTWVAVPLDHDAAVASATPFVLRAVRVSP